MIARQTAVETAIKMKGQRAEVVGIYNSYLPHPRGYKVKYDDMLCATYVSSIFIKLGWTDIVPPECGAPQLFRNMEALGRSTTDRTRIPDIGDLIFFRNPNRDISHVGIVVEVKGTQIYYYDIQSVVARHTCPVGYLYIYGYGLPDYASKDVPVPPAPHKFETGDLVKVKPGATWYNGASIKASVFEDEWYILQCKGDRAVLGMNVKETRNIQSPIHVDFLTLVNSDEQTQKVELKATVSWDTLTLLETLSVEQGKTIGEIIDGIVGGLR